MSIGPALKAIFGDEPFFAGATQGVQTKARRGLLLTALVSLASEKGLPLRILEVGSWVGFSALTWAHAIDRFNTTGGEVTCVDPWAPYLTESDLGTIDPVYRDMDRMARSGAAHALFLHNAGTGPEKVTIRDRRGRASDILPTLEANSYDIVFVDGSHYYEDVKQDLILARRLVAEGGILAGDDLEIQLSPQIEAAARASIDRDFVAMPDGTQYHPGVTLAVAEILGPVSAIGGTWFMRRRGDGFEPIVNDMAKARAIIPPRWPKDFVDLARQIMARK